MLPTVLWRFLCAYVGMSHSKLNFNHVYGRRPSAALGVICREQSLNKIAEPVALFPRVVEDIGVVDGEANVLLATHGTATFFLRCWQPWAQIQMLGTGTTR